MSIRGHPVRAGFTHNSIVPHELLKHIQIALGGALWLLHVLWRLAADWLFHFECSRLAADGLLMVSFPVALGCRLCRVVWSWADQDYAVTSQQHLLEMATSLVLLPHPPHLLNLLSCTRQAACSNSRGFEMVSSHQTLASAVPNVPSRNLHCPPAQAHSCMCC